MVCCHPLGLSRPADEDVIAATLVDVWEVVGVSPTTSMDGSSSKQTTNFCSVFRGPDPCNGRVALVVRLFWSSLSCPFDIRLSWWLSPGSWAIVYQRSGLTAAVAAALALFVVICGVYSDLCTRTS
jgi:hypothetical protein